MAEAEPGVTKKNIDGIVYSFVDAVSTSEDNSFVRDRHGRTFPLRGKNKGDIVYALDKLELRLFEFIFSNVLLDGGLVFNRADLDSFSDDELRTRSLGGLLERLQDRKFITKIKKDVNDGKYKVKTSSLLEYLGIIDLKKYPILKDRFESL